jgi:hypothetical protein
LGERIDVVVRGADNQAGVFVDEPGRGAQERNWRRTFGCIGFEPAQQLLGGTRGGNPLGSGPPAGESLDKGAGFELARRANYEP